MKSSTPPIYIVIPTYWGSAETAVSEGFEIWNSCVHARALGMVAAAYQAASYRRYADLMERAIRVLLTYNGRFLHRLDPNGNPDLRADITLMAPFYFGLYSTPTRQSRSRRPSSRGHSETPSWGATPVTSLSRNWKRAFPPAPGSSTRPGWPAIITWPATKRKGMRS